jgi:hypothetical protein
MAELRRTRAAVGARGTYTVDPTRLQELAGEAAAVVGSGDGAEAIDDVRTSVRVGGGYRTSASHTTTSTPSA